MEPHEPLTAAMLREFVLTIDLKLEQFRTEMHTEFGRVHARLERLETRLDALERRVDRIDQRLDRIVFAPLRDQGYTLALLTLIAAAVVYGVLR